jgi:uncharacterized protein
MRPRRRSTSNSPPRSKLGLVPLGCGVSVERDVRFTLPDGVVLVSDHYYPPGWPQNGPSPTLLVRQPYGKAVATTVVCAQPEWFARQGYNVVVQDVRGRGASGGRFYPFRHEGDDGAATIDWLARRPECNGRVGMYGFSYQGLTQLLAAARAPDALRCIVPAQTAGDLFNGWFYHHGAFRQSGAMTWAAQLLRADAHRLGLKREAAALDSAWIAPAALVAETPYGAAPQLVAKRLPAYFADWASHRSPGPYWSSLDISKDAARIRAPGLHIWGWFDPYLHGGALLFDQLTAEAAPEARDRQFLIAGPWVHIPWGRFAGESDFGKNAEVDTDRILLRWFNHWLRDSGDFDNEPRIRLFALGQNQWHFPAAWPGYGSSSARRITLHLRSGGRANSSRGDGRLTPEPPGDEPPDSLAWEPDVPPAPPGPCGAPGQFQQARADSLNNVLVYTSAPLRRSIHVCGPPRVRFHAASSAGASDWFAKLVRIGEDGRELNICHGIARSSWLFRGKRQRAEDPAAWEFPLEPTSCVFKAGEHIRLVVGPGAFPLYDRNPASDVSPELATPVDWRPSRQRLFHDSTRPGVLELPVL